MSNKLHAIIDGASRGNPGHGAAGGLIYDQSDLLLKKFKDYLGICTNNVAEYKALLICLQESLFVAGKNNFFVQGQKLEISIFSDSELLVKQFNGEYKIKNTKLKELSAQVREFIAEHKMDVKIFHVLRSETRDADRLANHALNIRGF